MNALASQPLALIVGAGGVLGQALALALAGCGHRVRGLRRVGSADSSALACDLADPKRVAAAVRACIECDGAPRVLIHNAAVLHRGRLEDTSPDVFGACWRVGVAGGFAAARAAAPAMIDAGGGSIFFVGATASLRGAAGFAAFASAKFAQRGLAQALARELQPRGLHVAHVVIDGLLRGSPTSANRAHERATIDPASVAKLVCALAAQPPDAWTHEVDVRPATEAF